jgi:hypothetical protein
MGEYVPSAGRNKAKLPNGGVYNTISFHAYNYSNNNPVKYADPDGEIPVLAGVGIGIAVVAGVTAVLLKMLPQKGDGYLYFTKNQPQRLGGYRNWYEAFTSNNKLCNIDSLRVDFTRANGKKASIWLWKGDYNMVFNGGWHTGGEIGAYNAFGFGDDSIIKSAFFSVVDANGNVIATIRFEGGHWINTFVQGDGDGSTNGANGDPSSMTMRGGIEFHNAEDAERFYRSLKYGRNNRFFSSRDRNGYKRSEEDYKIENPAIDGKKVDFDYK